MSSGKINDIVDSLVNSQKPSVSEASDKVALAPPAPTKRAVAVTRGAAAREWLGQTLRGQTRSWEHVQDFLAQHVALKPGAARVVLARMQEAAQKTFDSARRSSIDATTSSVAAFPSDHVRTVLRQMLNNTPTTPMAQTVQHLAVLSWMYAEGYNIPGVDVRTASDMRDDLRRAILVALTSSSPRLAIAKVMAEHIPELQ